MRARTHELEEQRLLDVAVPVDLGRERVRQLVVERVLLGQLLHGARDLLLGEELALGAVVVLDVVDVEVGVGDQSRAQRLHARVGRGEIAACPSHATPTLTADAHHVARETALRDGAAQLEVQHARDVARGDLVAHLLQQHLLVLRPLEAGQVHHQVAVALVARALRARALLQRSEAATRDLRVTRGDDEYALVVLVTTLTTDVRRHTHHGQHFANTSHNALYRHVMADLLRVDVADRIFVVVVGRVRRKHHIVPTTQLLPHHHLLVRHVLGSVLRLRRLFTVTLRLTHPPHSHIQYIRRCRRLFVNANRGQNRVHGILKQFDIAHCVLRDIVHQNALL